MPDPSEPGAPGNDERRYDIRASGAQPGWTSEDILILIRKAREENNSGHTIECGEVLDQAEEGLERLMYPDGPEGGVIIWTEDE